ncbi:uncharacterized protein ISCGN_012353 [Ixodes scapularis]
MGNAARLRFLLLQIFAAAWAVEEMPHPLTSNQRGFEEGSQFPSSPTTSADFLPGATFVWQRTGTLSCDISLQKEQPPTSRTGFGTGMGNAARLRFLLLQIFAAAWAVEEMPHPLTSNQRGSEEGSQFPSSPTTSADFLPGATFVWQRTGTLSCDIQKEQPPTSRTGFGTGMGNAARLRFLLLQIFAAAWAVEEMPHPLTSNQRGSEEGSQFPSSPTTSADFLPGATFVWQRTGTLSCDISLQKEQPPTSRTGFGTGMGNAARLRFLLLQIFAAAWAVEEMPHPLTSNQRGSEEGSQFPSSPTTSADFLPGATFVWQRTGTLSCDISLQKEQPPTSRTGFGAGMGNAARLRFLLLQIFAAAWAVEEMPHPLTSNQRGSEEGTQFPSSPTTSADFLPGATFVWQRTGTLSCDICLQKEQPPTSRTGFGAGMGNAARLRFLLLQIFAAAWAVEEMPHPLTSNQRGSEEGSQFPSSPTTSADFLPGATFVWQRTGTLSCDICLQKEQPPTSRTGFGAGMGNAARLRFLLLQIFAAAWAVEEMPHPLTSNQRGSEEGSQFPSSPTTSADFLPGATFVWQRTGTLSCDISLQKEQPPTSRTGFGTGMGNAARLRFLLLQIFAAAWAVEEMPHPLTSNQRGSEEGSQFPSSPTTSADFLPGATFVWQRTGTLSCDISLQKEQPPTSRMGFGAGMGNAARLRFLLLQIFAAAWAVEEMPHPLTSNQRGSEEGSQFPSSPTTSADFLPGATFVWQRTGTLSCYISLQKEQPLTSRTGFGAGMGNAARLRFLLLQIFAAAWAVEEMPHPLTSNQRGSEEGSQFPSLPTTSADLLPGATFVWQRTGTLSCDISLQKEQPPTSRTGFGAGMGNAARLRFLLLQIDGVFTLLGYKLDRQLGDFRDRFREDDRPANTGAKPRGPMLRLLDSHGD